MKPAFQCPASKFVCVGAGLAITAVKIMSGKQLVHRNWGAEFAGKISGAVRVPVGDTGKDASRGRLRASAAHITAADQSYACHRHLFL